MLFFFFLLLLAIVDVVVGMYCDDYSRPVPWNSACSKKKRQTDDEFPDSWNEEVSVSSATLMQEEADAEAEGQFDEDEFWFAKGAYLNLDFVNDSLLDADAVVFRRRKRSTRATLRPALLGNRRAARLKRSSNLPDYVNWMDADFVKAELGRALTVVLPHPKDQKGCGSCYVFSAISTFESAWAIKKKRNVTAFSEQHILDCGDKKFLGVTVNDLDCDGGFKSDVGRAVKRIGGTVKECSYPYHCGRVESCDKIVDDYVATFAGTAYKKKGVVFSIDMAGGGRNAMRKALYQYGPIAISMQTTKSFKKFVPTASNEVFGVDDGCSTQSSLATNHAVEFVGYGTSKKEGKYFILRNSWGDDFAEDGIIKYHEDCRIWRAWVPKVKKSSDRRRRKRQVSAEWLSSTGDAIEGSDDWRDEYPDDDVLSMPLSGWFLEAAGAVAVSRVERNATQLMRLVLSHNRTMNGDESVFYFDPAEVGNDDVDWLASNASWSVDGAGTFEAVLSNTLNDSRMPSNLTLQFGIQAVNESGFSWTRTRRAIDTLPNPFFWCLNEIMPYDKEIRRIGLRIVSNESYEVILLRGRFGASAQCADLDTRELYYRKLAEAEAAAGGGDGSDDGATWMIVGIVAVVAAVCIGSFVCFAVVAFYYQSSTKKAQRRVHHSDRRSRQSTSHQSASSPSYARRSYAGSSRFEHVSGRGALEQSSVRLAPSARRSRTGSRAQRIATFI